MHTLGNISSNKISYGDSEKLEATFCTPDSNKQLPSDSSQKPHHNDNVQKLQDEVNNTVDLGVCLGAENIGAFTEQVHDSLVNEDFQSVRGLRLEQQIGCVLFQETFCNNVGAKQIEGFWGRGCFDFASVDPTGRSGGLITMWDTSIFCLQPIISNRNLLVCSGHILGSGETINIINVYAPQGDVEKRHLWSVLINIIRGSNGLWIVGGDFNSVRNEHEQRNSIFNPAAARDFNDFIEDAGLHELFLRGRKFTFSVGNKLSRIDRFLVCWDFFAGGLQRNIEFFQKVSQITARWFLRHFQLTLARSRSASLIRG
ncbi:putative Endonuclease/exonuclease/phosphatase superfamily [Helianthus annuus]|nr:putative Endonuclease/exonuclease/phosphatase superfamily [Helianthus annuus]